MTAANLGVTLSAAFRVHDAGMEIDYELTNSGAKDVFVCDMGVSVSNQGQITIAPAHLEVEFHAPDLLILASKVYPLPPGTLTAVPRSFYVSLLAAGQSAKRSAFVSLPARQTQPIAPRAPHEVSASRVHFTIGLFPNIPELAPQEQIIAGKKVWQLNAQALRYQGEATVDSKIALAALVTK